MLDSGAFSVWSRGESIELDDYIKFCKSRPNMTVYIALDVIPPKGAKLTSELKDKVASEGWNNYLKMIRQVPMEKVMPVFHRGDSFKWLETMLDFECPYIGLAPRFDGTDLKRKYKFIEDCKKYVYDSSGSPITKTHGLAVTNHKMMADFKWHSVDSATWVQTAGWGGILVPPFENGQWNFKKQPFRVLCSVVASKRQDASHHVLAMREQRPQLFEIVSKWLSDNGIGLGKHTVEDANGRKPKNVVERWEDRAKTKILRIEERGVTNCDRVRKWINGVYFHRVNDALSIKNIYLAGSGTTPAIENQMRCRLRSFVDELHTTDWLYRRIGQWEQPFEFPSDVYKGDGVPSFSFKEN